jgi:putative heme-binding domain-containing protein
MVFFGPPPTERLLIDLSRDDDATMRAKSAQLLYALATPTVQTRLVELVADADPLVRRLACESIVRLGAQVDPAPLIALLGDDDRFVAQAARRALEQLPAASWAKLVLENPDLRTFCQGSVSLLALHQDPQLAKIIINRCQSAIAAAAAPDELPLADLLRVIELGLHRGKLGAGELPQLGAALAAQYPSGNAPADREFVRLLVHLQEPSAAAKFAAVLENEDVPAIEKLHVAAYAARLVPGWGAPTKLTLLRVYEDARAIDGGYSIEAYIENFSREFFARLTDQERIDLLAEGEQWPASSLSIIASMPANTGPTSTAGPLLAELRRLDGRIGSRLAESDKFRRLHVGILAVLGRSGEPASLEYLCSLYDAQPAERNTVAVALSQHPEGRSWEYLVDSLKTLDGPVAQEVLLALAKVSDRPKHPEAYRQVILLGLRMGDNGAGHALRLLDHWSGQQTELSQADWQPRLVKWQQWYGKHFPTAPAPELPVDSGRDKWSFEEMLTYLDGDSAKRGDPARGREAFTKAQCAACHRCQGDGATIGPDLSTVASRFQNREILESIVYPSHNISDQYASKTVTTGGKTYTGLVAPRGTAGVTVLLSSGEQLELTHDQIDDVAPSEISVMPSGLLNTLSLEQVADLFAYLQQTGTRNMAQKPQSPSR